MDRSPSSTARPIVRRSVPDTLAADLRRRILTGELSEGFQLRQDLLAKEYEVSRMPVREALRRLEAEGLVKFIQHRGAVVTTFSGDEIAELYDLRAMLEKDILRRAIGKHSQDDLDKAQAVLNRLDAAYAAAEVELWGELNWDFHAALYAPANRPQTLAFIRTLNFNTDRYARLVISLAGDSEAAQREHKEILELCRVQEKRKAPAALERHILSARDHLMQSLARSRHGR